ncbi:MAG: (2Fe-2S)-binding protein [Bacillota bacterium]
MKKIMLEINRKKYTLGIQDNWTLLYVLRDVLHLTGTKYGCGTGDCGACKVLIEGIAKNSCTLLAKNLKNKKITTIEGLSQRDKLHPVQEAFVEAGAIQCGYCTPGMVITALALLNQKPHPTENEIVEALDNNLCRCTGYKKIIDAIQLAAKKWDRR